LTLFEGDITNLAAANALKNTVSLARFGVVSPLTMRLSALVVSRELDVS
jgi:hypothetical protein